MDTLVSETNNWFRISLTLLLLIRRLNNKRHAKGTPKRSRDEMINYATKIASSLLLPPGELGKPGEDVTTVHE